MNFCRIAENASRRRGNVVVLTAFLLIAMLAMVAFAIDTGYMVLTKTQAQAAADASALAAGGKMYDLLTEGRRRDRKDDSSHKIRQEARKFCAEQWVGGRKGILDPDEDVVIGRLTDYRDMTQQIVPCSPWEANAIRVTVRRDAERGGAVPLFFAGLIGRGDFETEASATVVFAHKVTGIRPTAESSGPLLPYTIKETVWRTTLDGETGKDDWTYDAKTGKVVPGPDGIPEFAFFPTENASGNYGSIDLGGSNNATPDLRRQIREGVNEQDVKDFGGEFVLDETGSLYVNGDTGLSLAVESDMQAILGQPRLMPLFESVTGTGNNAMYRIVGFAGIRLMEVQLKGGDKFVLAQPAVVSNDSIVTGPEGSLSDDTVKPPILVR